MHSSQSLVTNSHSSTALFLSLRHSTTSRQTSRHPYLNIFFFILKSSYLPARYHGSLCLSLINQYQVIKLTMSIENQQSNSTLQDILKQTLEECVALARKKIRSKRGISDLQNILTDYHQNVELASIILQVIKLIVSYESSKRQEEQVKETVSLEDYAALQAVLQKCQASNREQIRNQQQLKIYCEELQSKRDELQANNKELLNSTKQIITNLKRQHQRLIEENAGLRAKVKDNDSRADSDKQREQAIMSSIKKARKMIDSHNSISHRDEARPGSRTDRSQSNIRLPKNSISSIKAAK